MFWDETLKPFPYQDEGSDWLSIRKAAFLADEAGLGKTVQAIKGAEKVGAEAILIFCPKSAVQVWHSEFRRWWPGGPTPVVLNFDKMSINADQNADKLSPEARSVLNSQHWDLLIIDEAHRLKTYGAHRTQNIYGKIKGKADRVWLLSATPTPNHNGELYSHLKALAPSYIRAASGHVMAQTEFEDEFCRVEHHPRFGRHVVGNSPTGTQKLKQIIAPMVLRRRKREVLPQLPPLRFVAHPLTDWDRKIDASKTLEAFKPPAEAQADPDALLQWLRSDKVEFSSERRATGIMKVPGVVDTIMDMIDDGQRKLLVFGIHRDVLDGIQRALPGLGFARIDGGTSQKDREKAVEDFMTKDDCEIFLGQIQACGEALTLTAGSEVLFAEASWTPSENYQAACRAHRIGQNNGVNARFLTVPGSVDELVMRVLARKAAQIAELFG